MAKKQTGIPFEDQKLQAAEMAKLNREVTRLSEECAFLKKVRYAMIKPNEKFFHSANDVSCSNGIWQKIQKI